MCQYHYIKKFRETPEGREAHRRWNRTYAQSLKGKQRAKNYQQSEVGRKIHKEENDKYRQSLRGLVKKRLYRKNLSFAEQDRVAKAFETFTGQCYVCGSTDPGSVKGWHLDHKGNRFRGILCHLCNCAAAFLRDDPSICRKLEEYLIKNGEQCQLLLAEICTEK